MARVVTWGAGGTYAGLYAAWTGETRDDDIQFLQTGTATDSSSLTHIDQNGYSVTITGNGDLYTNTFSGSTFVFSGSVQASGDIVIEHLNASTVGGVYIGYTTGTLSGFSIDVRYNKWELSRTSTLFNCSDNTSGYVKINYYANHFIWSGIPSSNYYIFNFSSGLGGKIPAGCLVHIEDNFITHTTGHTNAYVIGISGTPDGTISMRRNYCTGFSTDHTFYIGAEANILNSVTDTYTDYAEADISATHDSISFDLTNFLSITPSSELYGIPKSTSVLYIDATQISDIPDNIVGLNGETVDHRAAGAYTPAVVINPPTGISFTPTASGVNVTWTNTVQAGYPNTEIYWESISALSAFETPRATVGSGVVEYTIPYSQLQAVSSTLAYLRMTHGE